MKLSEINDPKAKLLNDVEHWIYGWERGSYERTKWLKTQHKPDIELDSSGKVIVHRTLDFSSARSSSAERFHEVAYPFAKIDGSFYLSYSDLSSFKNFPNTITGSLNINNCYISDFKNAPKVIGNEFIIGDQEHNKLTSLKGIHKHITKVGSVCIGGSITKDILGLILLEPAFISLAGPIKNASLQKAINILNNHLGVGKSGVLSAQQELIDADLDDYAEL